MSHKSLVWTKSSSGSSQPSKSSSSSNHNQLISYGSNKLIRKSSAAAPSAPAIPKAALVPQPAAPLPNQSPPAARQPSQTSAAPFVQASSYPSPQNNRFRYVRNPSATPTTSSSKDASLNTVLVKPSPPVVSSSSSNGPILRFSHVKKSAARSTKTPSRFNSWKNHSTHTAPMTTYRSRQLYPTSSASASAVVSFSKPPNRISAFVSQKLQQRRARGRNLVLDLSKKRQDTADTNTKNSSKLLSGSNSSNLSIPGTSTKARRVLIGGVPYALDVSGRTLKKVNPRSTLSSSQEKSKAKSTPPATRKAAAVPFVPNRVTIDGVTYIKSAAGNTLVRTKAKPPSSSSLGMNLLLKKKRTSGAGATNKTQCLFFARFGKCKRGTACKYLHDPSKVAVCRKFLKGECFDKECPLAHRISAKNQSMPVCSFFLKGICTNENCPYAHVKVSPDADVCQAFLAGFCPDGQLCTKLHTDECQAFKRTGSCPLGSSCKLKHVEKQKRSTSGKRKKSLSASGEKRAKITGAADASATAENVRSSDDALLLLARSNDAAQQEPSAPSSSLTSAASLMLHAGSIRPSFAVSTSTEVSSFAKQEESNVPQEEHSNDKMQHKDDEDEEEAEEKPDERIDAEELELEEKDEERDTEKDNGGGDKS